MKIPEAVQVVLERRDAHRRAARNEPRGSIEQVVEEAVADAFTGLAIDLLQREFTAMVEQVKA